jgi:hypothetical protein
LLDTVRQRGSRVPICIVSALLVQVLGGLRFAHEALAKLGRTLELAACELSPRNIIVGTDGWARLVDVCIHTAMHGNGPDHACAHARAYLAPETLGGASGGHQANLYSAGVLLWEAIAGERLFADASDTRAALAVRERFASKGGSEPSARAPGRESDLDEVALRALSWTPGRRQASAREMACDIGRLVRPAPQDEVAAWLASVAGDSLARQDLRLRALSCKARAPAPATKVSGVPRATTAAPVSPRKHPIAVQGSLEPTVITARTRTARVGELLILSCLVFIVAVRAAGWLTNTAPGYDAHSRPQVHVPAPPSPYPRLGDWQSFPRHARPRRAPKAG